MEVINKKELAIGIFDSGVGGLSVWKEIVKAIPNENLLYVSDNAYCPYGPKGAEEIIKRAFTITDFFIDKGVKLVVVACNTATAAAIEHLRERYKDLLIVGMEPAVKPAAIHSHTGVIGVLATSGTFKGKLYHRTVERFASDIEVIEQVGEGLVEQVEKGDFDGPLTKLLLEKYLAPMIEKSADHIVLGCTHYPFLIHEIRQIVGDKVTIVDPAPAVANHVLNMLESNHLLSTYSKIDGNHTMFYSTGDINVLKKISLTIHQTISDENYETITI